MKPFDLFVTEMALLADEMNLRRFLIHYSNQYNCLIDMRTINTYIQMMRNIDLACVRSNVFDTICISKQIVNSMINKGIYKKNRHWIEDYDNDIIMTPRMVFSLMRRYPNRHSRFQQSVKFLNAGVILYTDYKLTRADIDSLIYIAE